MAAEGESEAKGLFEAHKTLLGSVTIAWNDCTQLIFELFLDLSGMSTEQANIVFYGVRNDRTQRKIVRELATISWVGEPALLEALKGALKSLDQAAAVRNEATHSAWALRMAWTEDEHGLPTGWEPPQLVKVKPAGDEDDGFTERFEQLKSDLQNIAEQLIAILRSTRFPKVGHE